MDSLKNKIVAFAAMLALAATAAVAAPVKTSEPGLGRRQLLKKVRSELVTLPYYGVFDNLAYQVEGGTVTLYGQVVRPSTREDAGRRVAKLLEVERVINNIEVLPLSPLDDALRVRTYRTVFGTANLHRYALGANPAIHIIVNRGHVTLEGMVANEGDKRLAYIAARGVTGAFSVTNNLRAESGGRRAR